MTLIPTKAHQLATLMKINVRSTDAKPRPAHRSANYRLTSPGRELTAIFVLILCMAPINLATKAQAGERQAQASRELILRFPPGRPIGSIAFMSVGVPCQNLKLGAKAWEASGTQRIPAGNPLLFMANNRLFTAPDPFKGVNPEDIAGIDFFRTTVTDEWLLNLCRFPKLQQLHLSKTGISDKGLENIRCLKNLKVLQLDETKVTGWGFKYLSELAALETIELTDLPVNDDSCLTLLKSRPWK